MAVFPAGIFFSSPARGLPSDSSESRNRAAFSMKAIQVSMGGCHTNDLDAAIDARARKAREGTSVLVAQFPGVFHSNHDRGALGLASQF